MKGKKIKILEINCKTELHFMKIIWTLLKPERTQNPERAQNVLQLRSGFSTERTFFVLHSKKVHSGFSTEHS